MTVMPMFPLGMPLLPGVVLPLQVFEPRYRQMVQDLLAADDEQAEVGVVMIERGREVGGGDERTAVGTIASVVDIRAMPDGRYLLSAVGTDRIRVTAWLPDDPYPRAEVERWPDDSDDVNAPPVTAGDVERLHDRVRRLNEIVRELGEPAPPADARISDEPYQALFHLAALSPLGAVDRHRILAAPGMGARAAALAEALDDAAAVLEFRRA